MNLKLACCICYVLCSSPVAQAAAIVLYADKDTHITDNANLRDRNFGDDKNFIVAWSDNARSIGLVEFDLSSIPAGATVRFAELSLIQQRPNVRPQLYGVFQVTSPWSESETTYNSAPSIAPTMAASTLVHIDYISHWDVTSLVRAWLGGTPNFGMWIEEVPISDTDNRAFWSSDAGRPNRPFLVVSYVPEGSGAGLLLIGAAILLRCWRK